LRGPFHRVPFEDGVVPLLSHRFDRRSDFSFGRRCEFDTQYRNSTDPELPEPAAHHAWLQKAVDDEQAYEQIAQKMTDALSVIDRIALRLSRHGPPTRKYIMGDWIAQRREL
jgi:hypothetical protein